MEKADQDDLLKILESQFESGSRSREDILRTKMELETANSQLRSAQASEKNAKYMLWSVGAAALSAVIAALSAIASFGAAFQSQRIFAATERPWVGEPVSIEAKVEKGLVDFWHVFKNVGHSPTIGLFIDARIYPDWNYSRSGDDLERVCDKPDKQVLSDEGKKLSLVPGSDWNINSNNMPWFLERIESNQPLTLLQLQGMRMPNIVGCVAYLSRFDDMVVHHTAYFAGIKVKGQTITFPYIYAANSN